MCPSATYWGPAGIACAVALYASPMCSSRSLCDTRTPLTMKWATNSGTRSVPARATSALL